MAAVDGSGGSGDANTRVDQDANPAAAIFFVVVQLVLNAFILELFTGSIIDTYARLRDETRGSVLLSESQVSCGLATLYFMRCSVLSKPTS